MTAGGRSAEPRRSGHLARAALLLAVAATVVLLGSALHNGLPLLLLAALSVVVLVASVYWFLAYRGPVRWLALLLVVSTPLLLAWLLVEQRQLTALLVVAGLLFLGGVAGRTALAGREPTPRMPQYVVPPPRQPFLVMNPRSGGGKVGRFGLKEKAEALGAEVVLLEGSEPVDVVALARAAVGRGVDLLGVAGGDGTQALVAGVAAEHDLPFVVISAGTRNHFALDLGLDREDPSRCLAAMSEDAVELHVDLGDVNGRPFVNNASFGAYAVVIQSPEYRDDKARTTLDLLPDLLTGHQGPRLRVKAVGVVVDHPQAVLVSVDPYGMGDIAGVGRRARLDGGRLGVVAVNVESTREAVGLLRRSHDRGLTVGSVPDVVVTADVPEIPVGVDGEALVLTTPVRCTLAPRRLRVRVPRDRPGVPEPRPSWSWRRLWELADLPRPVSRR